MEQILRNLLKKTIANTCIIYILTEKHTIIEQINIAAKFRIIYCFAALSMLKYTTTLFKIGQGIINKTYKVINIET